MEDGTYLLSARTRNTLRKLLNDKMHGYWKSQETMVGFSDLSTISNTPSPQINIPSKERKHAYYANTAKVMPTPT
jgi:hypothetical protein